MDTLYVVNYDIDVGIRSVPCIRGNYEYVVPWVRCTMITMVYIVYVVRC